jgi:tRNA nucleotidyltransferase/poly(A) polymerase/nanoRNase/pAp phosphatase (c-di-AMP/oligoRNAs hydrolase)
MDLIVTHTGADFDALASLVACRKLYPDSRVAFLGTQEENLKQFLRDFGASLNITGSRGIDTGNIRRLIIVETSSPSRLGPFKNLLKKRNLEIHIYDHHPLEKNISAQKVVCRHIGATTTILIDILRRKKIKFNSLEATLFVLGIYEDTGSLTFPSTTSSDRKAVQFLISRGANLGLVTKYLSFSLTHDQITVLKDLVHSLETHYVNGLKVYIAKAVSPKYVGDIAVLAHSLREMESLDAIFILVKMEDRIQLVARSQANTLDVGAVARGLGGGGHITAASANIKTKDLEKTRLKLISAIRSSIKSTRPKSAVSQPKKERSILPLMKKRLPPELLKLFRSFGLLGDKLHMEVFLVGGFVRDLLLGVKDFDIDVVVEGDGLRFAKKLMQSLGGKLHIHKKFKTAVVSISNFKIDIATARTEYYERPGALPTVFSQSSIRADLSRRDFTINAIAIQLNRGHFGHLIDYYGGEKDLKKGIIRVLHNFSFIEDPTRIFRAVRFAERYNFSISKETEDLIKRAVRLELFESLTPERVRQELVAILSEEDPIKGIKRMAEFNELAYIHPSIKYDRNLHRLLTRISREIKSYHHRFPSDSFLLWVIYFMTITHGLTLNELKEVLQKFTFSKRERGKLFRSHKAASRLLKALGKSRLFPSRIYTLLHPLSPEEIIFLLSKTRSQSAKRNINFYLKKLRYVRIETRGEDLIKRGLKPGPAFAKILKKLLLTKLNNIKI